MKFCFSFYNFLRGIIFLSLWSLTFSQKVYSNGYTSYRRLPWCSTNEIIRHPKTIQDVVNIVHEAISRGITVKTFGQRHSQTDIICTEGIPMDSRGLRSFRINKDGVTATIGAGVNLRDATEFLRKYGRGLRTTPAFGNITLGGAIGTGAHGSTIRYNSSISSQVVALTVVDGRGNVLKISDPKDLRAFRLHLGLLGIVVDITLYTVPLYKTLAHNYVVPDDVLTNGVALNWAKTTDQIAFYWFPSFNEVVVGNWTIVDVDTPGNAYTNDHVPPTYANFNLLSNIIKEISFDLTASACTRANSLGYTLMHMLEYYMELALLIRIPDFVPIYTEDGRFNKNPAVGYYDLMFAPICHDEPRGFLQPVCPWTHNKYGVTFVDEEFGLDVRDLPALINDVKDIISKTPIAFPIQGILMRFSDKTDIYMSNAYGRQTVHFEWYEWKRNDYYNDATGSLAGYQTILQTLIKKYRARSHWGKSGLVYHNSESLDLKLDPVARRKFIDAMNEFDPDEIFMNNFGRRIKRKGTKVDIDPLTKHCAILHNCFCAKNSDCGVNQICTTLPGYTYNVCKTRNEVPELRVDRNAFPPPLGMLGYILRHITSLTSKAYANCSSIF